MGHQRGGVARPAPLFTLRACPIARGRAAG